MDMFLLMLLLIVFLEGKELLLVINWNSKMETKCIMENRNKNSGKQTTKEIKKITATHHQHFILILL